MAKGKRRIAGAMASHKQQLDMFGAGKPEDRGLVVADGVTSFTKDLAPNLALPWVLRLRYGMAAGEAAIIVAVWRAFQLDPQVLWALSPLVVVLASNVVLERFRNLALRFPQATLGAVFCLDTICLTAILGLTGGPLNPFSLLYLVQITVSAVVLRKTWTWSLCALSTCCFGLLFFPHVQTHHVGEGFSPHLIGMWIAFAIAAVLITFFTSKIADTLRRREQEVLALQVQVARNERLASLVTLAAGAAHELGTPLGTIAIVAKELERYAAGIDQAVLDDARLIRSEVDRCRFILERMSVRGAEPMGETARAVKLSDLLNQVVRQFPESQSNCIVLELPDPNLTTVLPEQATVQSIAALVQNALDANVDNLPVVIAAAQKGDRVAISVTDHGCGMADEVMRRVAEPFFTTKEPGKGMGLGTFLVQTLAERLGGRLTFSSRAGAGTTATLELPLSPVAHGNNGEL